MCLKITIHLPEGMYIVKIDGTNDGTYGMKVCKKLGVTENRKMEN